MRVAAVSPAMLRLFGADDIEALERRLVKGEGPSARRLRHLAATLPGSDSPRLEHLRVGRGPRQSSVAFSCICLAGRDGADFIRSAPAEGEVREDLEWAAALERASRPDPGQTGSLARRGGRRPSHSRSKPRGENPLPLDA